MLRGIESVVGGSIGARVRHVGSEIVQSPRTDVENYVNSGRIHTAHRLEVEGEVGGRWASLIAGGRITVFVKTGRNLTPSPAVLNEVESPDFRAPRCFGAFEAHGLLVEVSEHVEGERTPFKSLPRDAQNLLVRAVAGVNAVRADDVPIRTRWLGIPFEWFEERCTSHGGDRSGPWRAALTRIARIDRVKDAIRASIRGGQIRLFTHNDISPGNVLFGGDGQIRIIDWEKATRSLPGADLRFLIDMADKDFLLDCYLARMSDLGVLLERDRVLRVMEVTEAFRRMRAGCANGSLRNVVSGLDMLDAHFPP